MAGPLLRALCMLTHLLFSTNPERYVRFVNEESQAKRETGNVPIIHNR